MKTKEYIIDNCQAAFDACDEILQTIPCFGGYVEDSILPYASFSITCREEDLAYVEKKLAEFV